MTTINVNLTPCQCPVSPKSHRHWAERCAAKPVEIPCPITPTVTLTVRLGECTCTMKPGPMLLPRTVGLIEEEHEGGCPAHPIRVTCTIGGDGTWAGSEVTDARVLDMDSIGLVLDAQERGVMDLAARLVAACRARWALVKAMVTGKRYVLAARPGAEKVAPIYRLFEQRDAIFAALAKAHRAEDTLIEALGDYEEAMRGEPVGIYGLKRESHGALERYVKRLIEQVGNP